MCGIIGMSSKGIVDPTEVRIMLMLAQDRGKDSTGLATPKTIKKKAEDAETFIRRAIPETNLLIGHTRAKTTGAITDRNAHPFQSGDLIGTHNGYISNYWQLKREENQQQIQVDSEIIWHLINKYGLKESIPKLQGSFALAWIDGEENLNLYRHTNPIWTGRKGDTFYYGSKELYLAALDCNDIYELDEHHHAIIKEGEVRHVSDLTHIKPKKRYYSGYNNPYAGGTCNRQTQQEKKSPAQRYPSRFAPDDADYVTTAEGYIIYYWFDVPQTKISVEPVYSYIDYKWMETYKLENENHIRDMKNLYPEVAKAPEVQKLIQTINSKV